MKMGMVVTILIDTEQEEDETFIDNLLAKTDTAMVDYLGEDGSFAIHLHDIDLNTDLSRVEFDIEPEYEDELSEEE